METQMQFRISCFLKDLIGRELITDEFVAVFELVKNSFDANAKKVKIIFEDQYNSEKAKIIIWDDGIGMNRDDLKNKWLFVAKSDKRDGSEDKDYRDKIQHRRVFAGAKGVGRFSCDRLGKYLNLISLKQDDNSILENLLVDWTTFEKDSNKEFIDIKVTHKILKTAPYEAFTQGTILEISGLRDIWDRTRILNLKHSLEKLINPVQNNDSDNFSIEIIAKDELLQDKNKTEERDRVNGVVRNLVFEALGLKTTQIKVSIIENGGIILTTLIDRGTEIYTLKELNSYKLLSDIDINLFVLNRAGKMNFKKIMGINSVDYGSVFIYKNGFRIYPFGEEGDDTLKIDRRKQQGFYRFLGTRDLIGRIEINGEKSDLKETTSRDGGLIKNSTYGQLVDMFYDKALRRLETYTVDTIKWGDERFDKETGELIQPELRPDDVKDKIIEIIANLTKTKDVIDIQYNKDFLQIYEARQEKSATQLAKNLTRIAETTNNPEFVKQARAVERSISDLRKAKNEVELENDEVKKENQHIKGKISQYETENLFLRSDVNKDVKQFESLQHHITHTSNSIAAFSLKAIDAINANDTDSALSYLNHIVLENKKISTLSNFVSKAKFDTMAKKIDRNLVEFVDEYINNVYSFSDNSIKIQIQHSDVVCQMKFIPIEMIIVLDNLFSNSQKANATVINIFWEKTDNHIKFHFIDNGNGISDENLPHIFDFRFTTTKGGGLGLYHIKDIIQKMKGEIVVNNKKDKGVEFIIIF